MNSEEMEFMAKGINLKIFPLYTFQNLADRLGISRQLLVHYRKIHEDIFPAAIGGILADISERKVTVYPFYAVERYEIEFKRRRKNEY